MTECDEIVMDNAPTKMTNTIATNVTSTASIHCKKVRDIFAIFSILFYQAIILLLIITVICYNYANHKGII